MTGKMMTDRTLAPVGVVPQYEVQEINIREYLFVLLKRKTLIIALVLLCLALGIIYTLFQTRVYRSTSRINIDTSTYNVIPEVVSQRADLDVLLQTQLELLTSRTVASRVQKKLNIAPHDLVSESDRAEVQSQWAQRAEADRTKYVIDQLKQMIRVSGIRKTTLFDLSFITPDPVLSQTLANTWALEYVEYSLAAQYQHSRKAEELLASQVKKLQKEIAEQQKKLLDYSAKEQVILLDNAGSINMRKLGDLNSSLSEAISVRIAREVAYRDLRNHGKNAVPEIRNSPVISRLKQEYALLEQQYSQKSSLYMPDFPIMQSLKDQMNQLQKAIDEEGDDLFSKVLANAKADYEDAVKNESALKNEVNRVRGETITAGQEEFNYGGLKSELDEKRRHLEALQQKQTEASASAQAKQMKATTIFMVDEAQLPDRQYKPDVFQNIGLSILAGLIIGVGFAFLSVYFDRSLKHAEDVQRHAQLPLLGIVPQYLSETTSNNGHDKALMKRRTDNGTSTENIDLLSLYNPESLESEAFRTIRASLLVSFPEGPPRTILVTSAQMGEGKTFVACNLAISLAQLDKKVVLVDADMRNPRIHRIWKLNNNIGLSNFLTSDIQSKEILNPSSFQGLNVITSGTRTPRPAELLSSRRFDDLLSQLQSQFDHIIIDSPPVLPVSDPLVLAAKCHSVVFVIRAGSTPREIVQIAKQKLIQFDADIAGTVLNGIDFNDPYYQYGYYAAAYGKYYGEQAAT
jgi:polysaccharide biosynthesis transport protein